MWRSLENIMRSAGGYLIKYLPSKRCRSDCAGTAQSISVLLKQLLILSGIQRIFNQNKCLSEVV